MKALRFAVIGSPVAHSMSPGMHAAAYRALGLPHVYEKIETTEAEVGARVEALRRGEFAGLNVTVPHKIRVQAFVDEIDARARVAGAANTLVRGEDGRITAHNTDVPALAGELVRLAEKQGAETFRGSTALVLGAGGAARAAIVALASMLGVARIVVRDVTFPHHAFTAEMRGALAAIGARVEIVAEPLVPARSEAANLSAIVQATSCGMNGGAPGEIVADAVGWSTVPDRVVALDVVYAPRSTPLLARARARGLVADNGLGMLARQGALAFERWLGVPAPFDVMRADLEASRSLS
ncbi:MAG: shikimate dehydrogenase [Polyangiaceae bacterium]|nr:shikimate dehydrogenase [Polyangiaceae bacterium]